MDDTTNTSNPSNGNTPAAPDAHAPAVVHAPAYTLVSSPVGFGPLIPSSSASYLHGPPIQPAGSPDAQCLLDGFSRLLHFLLNEEVTYLCGVPRKARSERRLNFRGGYRDRKLCTRLGTISIRIPLLRYLHPRVSIVKRAKRLSPDILAQLARIHSVGVTADDAVALIKSLWTVTLSDSLLESLAGKLALILNEWRDGKGARWDEPDAPEPSAPDTSADTKRRRADESSSSGDDTITGLGCALMMPEAMGHYVI